MKFRADSGGFDRRRARLPAALGCYRPALTVMNFEAALLNVTLLWMLTAPHEFAHAWVATKLGDDTPGREGRVTLNPLAHVDWIGTTLLPAITSLLGGGFIGWGKPVNTDPRKLRGGLKGLAVVALAGPFSNIVFAVILAAAAVMVAGFFPAAAEFAAHGVRLSLYLAIFNLLPVPPLDGSKLLLAANVPAAIYNELARFGFLLLIVALSATGLGTWMSLLSLAGTQTIFSLFRV
jgi:Zn-dependent protease